MNEVARRFLPALLLMAAMESNGQLAVTAPQQGPQIEAETEKKWSFGISAFTYVVPDSREYVQPTLIVDRDWLHVEARYNYEALDTGSAWIGWNFSGGEKISWEITPIVGGVFGDRTGVAPGYKGSLSWWKLDLYSEGEFVFDTDGLSESFFYNWSELSLSPVDWFRFGMVTQRTRAYQSDRDIQRGFLIGAAWKHLDLTTYVFNPDDKLVWVFAVGLKF